METMQKDPREIRGYAIIAKGDNPIPISEEEFLVPSQSSSKKYRVKVVDNTWQCECPDFQSRQQDCKHIHAIKTWLKLRDSQESDVLEFLGSDNEEGKCPQCKGNNIVQNGTRKTKCGARQRYKCKECGKRFVLEPLKKHLLNAKMLCLACDLYFKGNSLRDIQDTLKQSFGIKINHETIRQNILKFTAKMDTYVNTLNPSLGNSWHADEQKVKCKGDWRWEWNIVDKETRYLIANNTTKGESRTIADARGLFRKTKENLQKGRRDVRGVEIFTDGLPAYHDAINKEFITKTRGSVTHRPTTDPSVEAHANLIVERYHNQYREFDKIRRDFKTEDTLDAWNKGFRVYNNFIDANNGKLNGLTPAQVAGVGVWDRNRWLSLLKLSLGNATIG